MRKITLIAAAGVLALAACDDVQEKAPAGPAVAPASAPAPIAEPGAELAANDPVRAEVQAVLDARLTGDLGVPAKIEIEIARGAPPWAFVSGPAVTASGGEIDFSKTTLAEAASEGMIDGANVIALLRRAPAGGWTVVEIHIGPTDVPQVAWPQQYGVSPALVGQETAEGGE
jgi:hypothetical protein